MSSQTSQKWTDVFVSGDFEQFCGENRGGSRGDEFYDIFPELELEAKTFALGPCVRKSADFTALDLVVFVDQKYYEVTDTIKDNNANLVRSQQSCRLNLHRWGARFESNSQRPYFEGHERVDVVQDRQSFIQYFIDRKDHYYTIPDDEKPLWKMPKQNPPCVLLYKGGVLCKN
ncbi:unnamed protein product [Didymodactylos carnosus]|uniref:Uncharacterized protein n=1 Tax=Didymodactylos carnosus TaxID=1234261 RepID=A0A814QT97_9BILA|nr:unnamed protein product [Didymodactylos carnosus]CAF1402337.1 unnamed protein product [Didymodactylos carnosus]CAF3887577.1 unnamed protein product [Didymodactylos carnosus]CAF4209115.1 unnamed protein product [Didymodactylos carnosus]